MQRCWRLSSTPVEFGARRALVVAVSQVPETYAHVVVNGVGYRDGDTKAKDTVRDAENVEVAVLEKKKAGGGSPGQGGDGEKRIGDVGDGKEHGRGNDGGAPAREQTQESQEKEVLENELLQDGPDHVSPHVTPNGNRPIKRMQGAEPSGEQQVKDGQDQSGSEYPERTVEAGKTQSEFVPMIAGEQGSGEDPGESQPEDDALHVQRGPNGGEYEDETDGDLDNVARSGTGQDAHNQSWMFVPL